MAVNTSLHLILCMYIISNAKHSLLLWGARLQFSCDTGEPVKPICNFESVLEVSMTIRDPLEWVCCQQMNLSHSYITCHVIRAYSSICFIICNSYVSCKLCIYNDP